MIEVGADLVRRVRAIAPLHPEDGAAARHQVGQAACIGLPVHERPGHGVVVAPRERPQEGDTGLLLATVVDRVERDGRVLFPRRPDAPQ